MKKYHILLIEDEQAIRESLSEMLEIFGHKVVGAINGKEGLEQLEVVIPDIIITDVMMPEMDGFDFLKAIRKKEEYSMIPVIMLTAKVDVESKLHGLELGADDYITKPFEFRELNLKINNILKSRERIIELATQEDPLDKKIISQEEIFLKKFRLLLDESLGNVELNVSFLAKHLNMSSSTLQRRVQKIIGQPTVQVIKEYKLVRAQRMIKANYGTLSEIAFKTGFKSLAYFSTSYKEHFGHSPKEDLPS